MKRVALVSLLSSLSVLVACQDPDDVDCDLMAVSAIVVSVVDADGMPIEGASVFANDGADDVECHAAQAGEFSCYEVGGDVVVSVDAEGFEGLDADVFVEVGPCHPVTEFLDVELSPVAE
jgi:hypothetical protein